MINVWFLVSIISCMHCFVVGSGYHSLRRAENFQRAKDLIARGVRIVPDYMQQNERWCSDLLLHNNAWHSDVKLLKLFIDNGVKIKIGSARVEYIDCYGEEFFIKAQDYHAALFELVKDIEVAQCLIDHGAQVPESVLVLNKAWRNNQELTELFLKHGADPDLNRYKNQNKNRPLENAENIEVADCLLRHGAHITQDVLIKNKACHSNAKMMSYLRTCLKKIKPDIDIKKDQKDLLFQAKNIGVVRWLLRYVVEIQPDILVKNEACQDNVKMMQLFLRHSADVKDASLEKARSLAVVNCLLRNGAKVDKDILVKNPVCKSNAQITELLIKNGADVHAVIVDPQGETRTLLEMAENIEVAQCLINHDAKVCLDILHKNQACQDNPSLVDFFIKHGADVNAISTYFFSRNKDLLVPLRLFNHVEIVDSLLRHGSRLNNLNPLVDSVDYDSAKKLIDDGISVPERILATNQAWCSDARMAELFIKNLEIKYAKDLPGWLDFYFDNAQNAEVVQCLIDHGAKVDKNILVMNPACKSRQKHFGNESCL